MEAMQNISKVVYAAVAGAALMGAGLAHATLDPGAGDYIFEGDGVELTKDTVFGPSRINCILALQGSVSQDSTNTYITVSDGDTDVGSANDGNCDSVSFTFSWPSDPIPNSSLGSSSTDSKWVSGTFDNVTISTPIGDCTGDDVPVKFRNTSTDGVDEPSEFWFDNADIGSSCTVNGNIFAVSGSDLDDDGTDELSDSSDIDAYNP